MYLFQKMAFLEYFFLSFLVMKILGSFRLDYEYEIEYEYDFRISNR